MNKNNKAIVSVINDLYTDQRVHKVCLFLKNQGYDVLLVGRNLRSSIPLKPRVYKTKRMSLFFEKGAFFYAEFNLRLFLLLLFRRSNLLVSNDLDTLLANFCASKFKRKVKLVYDSHEFFTEVPELVNRPNVQKIWGRIEAYIFPKLIFIYTVNNSIAKLYSEKYNKDLKVVRNISLNWIPQNLKSREELGLPLDKKIIIIQGAGINIDRGAEEAVDSMRFIEEAVLIMVGDGDIIPKLKKHVEKVELSHKVLFFGKKPYSEMMNYTYCSDIGLTLDKPTNINYKNSLPNKVFDYIHAETPIIATPIFEVKAIIEKYNVGCIIDDINPENLALTINKLLRDNQLLSEMKENCKAAKKIENWENESKILTQIYPKIDE